MLKSGTGERQKFMQEYVRRSSFPAQVLIESTSFCNLRCAMCARNYNPRKFGVMKESLARKAIDEIAREAPDTRVWFCYFGEPLIMKNAGLFERIKYATDKGISRTVINTNGNLMDEECVDKMIWSGLKEVYVGIDAITKETYEKLRIRGNYETLIRNIDIVLKKAAGKIVLTVQFAVLDENEHELAEFERYWKSRSVKIFIRPKMTWINYISDKVKSEGPRQPCSWMFDSLNINEDGRVPYCIMDWQNRLPLGDIRHETLKDIWQKKVRPYILAHARCKWEKLPKFCRDCPDWQSKTYKSEGFLENFRNDEPF